MSQPEAPVAIRFMKQADVPDVLACEVAAHEYVDEDFGVPQLPVYAWTEQDILDAVRQYKSKLKKTDDTRALVMEAERQERGPDGLAVTKTWVCGAFLYELRDDGYEVLLLTAHPDAPANARREMVSSLVEKAKRSDTRRKVACYVPDGDYTTLKVFMSMGFSHKLAYNPNGNDAWLCELSLSQKATTKVK
jgi:hypothetical protein